MSKVLNMYHTGKKVPEGAVYIGRPTKWGNTFEIDKDGTREEVVAKYEKWLRNNPKLLEEAKSELRGKDLICWCAPRPCHGDVLLRLINE
jgi:hypothetical protein